MIKIHLYLWVHHVFLLFLQEETTFVASCLLPWTTKASHNGIMLKKTMGRLIESMMGLRPRQGNLRLVFRLFSLKRGLPSI